MLEASSKLNAFIASLLNINTDDDHRSVFSLEFLSSRVEIESTLELRKKVGRKLFLHTPSNSVSTKLISPFVGEFEVFLSSMLFCREVQFFSSEGFKKKNSLDSLPLRFHIFFPIVQTPFFSPFLQMSNIQTTRAFNILFF